MSNYGSDFYTLVPLPALIESFRTGRGVPYPDYGVDAREGQAIHKVTLDDL